MSRISFLLDAVLMARPVLRGVAMRRMMPKLLRLLALGVVFTILATAVILGGFMLLHHVLVASGYTPLNALYVTVATAFGLLMICALVIRHTLSGLKQSTLPSPDMIGDMVGAFLDGLGGEKRRD